MTIASELGEVKGKLDMLIDLVKEHSIDDKKIHAAQEARIAELEADNNKSKGMVMTIGGLAGAAGGFLFKYLFGAAGSA